VRFGSSEPGQGFLEALFYLLADALRRVRQRPFERAAVLYLVSATHLARISEGGFNFLFRNK